MRSEVLGHACTTVRIWVGHNYSYHFYILACSEKAKKKKVRYVSVSLVGDLGCFNRALSLSHMSWFSKLVLQTRSQKLSTNMNAPLKTLDWNRIDFRLQSLRGVGDHIRIQVTWINQGSCWNRSGSMSVQFNFITDSKIAGSCQGDTSKICCEQAPWAFASRLRFSWFMRHY